MITICSNEAEWAYTPYGFHLIQPLPADSDCLPGLCRTDFEEATEYQLFTRCPSEQTGINQVSFTGDMLPTSESILMIGIYLFTFVFLKRTFLRCHHLWNHPAY